MKLLQRISVLIWCLSLMACTSTPATPCEECEVCHACEICPNCEDTEKISLFNDGLVLPQVYIQGKLFWTNQDLSDLEEKIIQPIVNYFEEQGHTVVSISVRSEDLASGTINSIIVEAIISDNDGNQEPLHMGVLIEKEAGFFPLWSQEDIGP